MVKTKFRLAVIPHIPLILAFRHRKTVWSSLSTVGSWPKTQRYQMGRVTMRKYSYSYIQQTGSNAYNNPHSHSSMSLKCLSEMYLHEDQIFVLNHNILLSNRAQEELMHSTADREEICKWNIKFSVNKMNGRVILCRGEGGKENECAGMQGNNLWFTGYSFQLQRKS